jgi:predicted nucleotidyltransferase
MRHPKALPPNLSAVLRSRFQPKAVYLFGSRARGDARPDSDWDVLVVVRDENGEMTDPRAAWEASREARDLGVQSTVLVTTEADLKTLWGLPNTIGYDIAHEGVAVSVD